MCSTVDLKMNLVPLLQVEGCLRRERTKEGPLIVGMEMHGFRPVPVHIPPPAVVLDGATEGKTVAALQGGEERLAVKVLRAIEDVQVLQRPANFTGAPWPCSLTILSMYKTYYYSPLFKSVWFLLSLPVLQRQQSCSNR